LTESIEVPITADPAIGLSTMANSKEAVRRRYNTIDTGNGNVTNVAAIQPKYVTSLEL